VFASHGRGMPSITRVRVVAVGLRQIANNCSYLMVLDIRGCHLVSQSGMDAVAMMLPACRVHFIDGSAGKR
jgi:hypothetical protein